MFDFHNLNVYNKAKVLNQIIFQFLSENKNIDYSIRDQLKRASLSIVLNIAEGSGKFTKPDKRNFYIIARGSTYECVAICDVLVGMNYIDKQVYESFVRDFEEISKMLLALIKSQS